MMQNNKSLTSAGRRVGAWHRSIELSESCWPSPDAEYLRRWRYDRRQTKLAGKLDEVSLHRHGPQHTKLASNDLVTYQNTYVEDSSLGRSSRATSRLTSKRTYTKRQNQLYCHRHVSYLLFVYCFNSRFGGTSYRVHTYIQQKLAAQAILLRD